MLHTLSRRQRGIVSKELVYVKKLWIFTCGMQTENPVAALKDVHPFVRVHSLPVQRLLKARNSDHMVGFTGLF